MALIRGLASGGVRSVLTPFALPRSSPPGLVLDTASPLDIIAGACLLGPVPTLKGVMAQWKDRHGHQGSRHGGARMARVNPEQHGIKACRGGAAVGERQEQPFELWFNVG